MRGRGRPGRGPRAGAVSLAAGWPAPARGPAGPGAAGRGPRPRPKARGWKRLGPGARAGGKILASLDAYMHAHGI